MAKQVIFAAENREKLLKGVNALSNAVKVTLGPKGRNVLIDKSFGAPLVTKDGVTVAKEIELEDKLENMGAQMVKEVASKTSDVAGDGTTTATVLAQAIVTEGHRNLAAGANPMDLKRGIEQAVAAATGQLHKMSKSVSDSKEIAQVGTVSANNDTTIGDIIAESMEKVGGQSWLYFIDYLPRAMAGQMAGSPHGLDAWLLFSAAEDGDSKSAELSRKLRVYWTNFAKFGDPDGCRDDRESMTKQRRWQSYQETGEWKRFTNGDRVSAAELNKRLVVALARYRARIKPFSIQD